MTPRKIVVASIVGPAAVWAFLVATGKPMDSSGTMLVGRGLVLPFRFGLAVEAAAAAVLVTWLVGGLRAG